MKTHPRLLPKVIYFSCWCRKGYAIFAAIGRQVLIAAVSLRICRSALLKTARKGAIIISETCWDMEMPADVELETFLKMRNMLPAMESVCPDKSISSEYRTRVCPNFRHTLVLVYKGICSPGIGLEKQSRIKFIDTI